jgi:hypothetical protein
MPLHLPHYLHKPFKGKPCVRVWEDPIIGSLTWRPTCHPHIYPQHCYTRQAVLSPSRTTVIDRLLLRGMSSPQHLHPQTAAGRQLPHGGQTETHRLWAGHHSMVQCLHIRLQCIQRCEYHDHGLVHPVALVYNENDSTSLVRNLSCLYCKQTTLHVSAK